jgi:hypothetical protein
MGPLTAIYRAAGDCKRVLARLRRPPPPHVTGPPHPQLALDLFAGEWSSRLPPPLDTCRAGEVPLFADPRLAWGLEALGSVAGRRVLELGPLEGAHSYMLERAGAAEVVAVEANARAYLRCLVVKELLGLTRVRFLLGDFTDWLGREPADGFDVAIASGVLYHARNPAALLHRLARVAPRLYLWTHYFDEARVRARPKLAARFDGIVGAVEQGFPHTLHVHRYQAAPFRPSFSGGSHAVTHWLSREDVLGLLRHLGFGDLQIGCEEPDHPNGPAFGVVARR